jgi:GntR family transcriptional regulator
VRKALDAMAIEGVVERHQGKGTFVAEHTQERTLFRFFRLVKADGTRLTPTSSDAVIQKRAPSLRERTQLGLDTDALVIGIVRTRSVDGVPAVIEKIALPAALFPELEMASELPNALYTLYQQRYGLNIVTTTEALKAQAATAEDCKRLPVAIGTPLLTIERVAIALDGTLVEYRLSRCDTSHLCYMTTLR